MTLHRLADGECARCGGAVIDFVDVWGDGISVVRIGWIGAVGELLQVCCTVPVGVVVWKCRRPRREKAQLKVVRHRIRVSIGTLGGYVLEGRSRRDRIRNGRGVTRVHGQIDGLGRTNRGIRGHDVAPGVAEQLHRFAASLHREHHRRRVDPGAEIGLYVRLVSDVSAAFSNQTLPADDAFSPEVVSIYASIPAP